MALCPHRLLVCVAFTGCGDNLQPMPPRVEVALDGEVVQLATPLVDTPPGRHQRGNLGASPQNVIHPSRVEHA